MELQDSKLPTNFELFLEKFKEFWETEKPTRLVNRHHFFYEEGINIINIYQQTKRTKVAYFTKERAWIDSRLLFRLLFDEFKEYSEYLKGRKSLLG